MTRAASTAKIAVTWGVENRTHYREQSTLGMNAWARELLPEPFRYVKFKEPPSEIWFECLERHRDLWKRFQMEKRAARHLSKRKDPRRLEAVRLDFQEYKRREDPYCIKVQEDHAPILYFDFITDSNDTYILNRLEVETLAFSEYRGGGFVNESGAYDILLCHRPGVRQYAFDKRLKFSAAGHVKLRFFSDNYEPTQGWIAPMGAYVLRIAFHFVVASRGVGVATDVFMMDV